MKRKFIIMVILMIIVTAAMILYLKTCGSPKETLRGRDHAAQTEHMEDIEAENSGFSAGETKYFEEGQNIRVLLSCDGYTGYMHDSVTLTSQGDFVSEYNGEQRSYPAGEILTLDRTVIENGQSIKVFPKSLEDRIEILSLNRSSGHPQYRGFLEITHSDGGLVLVNELAAEEYLYGVLPSEMPPSYPAEALKVQAVCARSFAATALKNMRFPEQKAHVDDSTATQVYNNVSETEDTNAAVDATKGCILTWDNQPLTSYFYSTSCGSTSSPSEIWLSDQDSSVIEGRLQILGDERERDFSSESAFKDFIDHYKDMDYFEKDISWFRWTVTSSLEHLRESVEKNLAARIAAVPDKILVKNAQGVFESAQISSIGDIMNISVDSRAKSGVLTSVIIEGSENTIKVSGEYNIRLLLAPIYSDVVCHDGTNAGTMNLLPSGYFYMTVNSDQAVTFTGGGYGHGTGMSQNGVYKLAQRGLGWEEILTFYFPEAIIAH